MTAILYTDLARDLAMHVRHALTDRQVWNAPSLDTRHDPDDIKSRHGADDAGTGRLKW
ncbi:MAG: hypothetical protein ACFB9N_06885 [Geitlerinemataceae cyanobacterium]